MSVVPLLIMAAGGAGLVYAYNAYIRKPTFETVYGSTEALTFVQPGGVEIYLPEADSAYATASTQEQVPYVIARMIEEQDTPTEILDSVPGVQRMRAIESWGYDKFTTDAQAVANQPHLQNRGKNSV